jgi:hypothetical protein
VLSALGWDLPRTTVALAHAHRRPHLVGSHALRRVPPGRYTVTPRLDILDADQRDAIRVAPIRRGVMGEPGVAVLLEALTADGAIAIGPDRRQAIDALVLAGYLHRHPDGRVTPSPDVLYSLRYTTESPAWSAASLSNER